MWPFRKKKTDIYGTDFSDKLAHVAFIMDGNGRWASARGMRREMGHSRGIETFRRIVRYCHEVGVRNLTVYAFSTENWSRPKEEVDALMGHLDRFMDEEMENIDRRNARIVFLGDKSPLAPHIREKAEKIERLSADKPLRLNIAMNYGGRDEILHACNALLQEAKREVTKEDLAAHLYTAGCPDPDLIFRTGGDLRLSNFLLYQAAYSEFYFTPTLWPDLTEAEVYRAFCDFCTRHRRFGGLDKENSSAVQGKVEK